MEHCVQKIRENIWTIEQRGVRAFLLVGQDAAILVDTCFGGDIREVCASITDKPITLVTTHADPDHMGDDHLFPNHYLHAAEFARYEKHTKQPAKALPLQEGDVLEVDGFRLEVILIPGHTPGSIALLDRQNRVLIAGDSVQDHCIFMHGEGRDLKALRSSLERLNQMRRSGEFDTVFASHGTAVLPADILEDVLALADAVLAGTAVPVADAPDWFPDTVKTYGFGRTKMYY